MRDDKTYEERLKAALAAHTDETKPFVTWGYHHYFHGDMSRALDQLAPDLPVVVWHRSCHEIYLNSAALKLTGIDATRRPRCPKPPELGAPSSTFIQRSSSSLIAPTHPRPSDITS